jgi:hypothetical protein
VICHLCRQRKARRSCPALGQEICAVCCGTKRLVEIACPPDCPYLVSAREHPPAVVVRQHQDDLAVLTRTMRDLNERQSRLLFLLFTFFAERPPTRSTRSGYSDLVEGHEALDLQSLIDADIAEATGALAATYETAVRGVIYDHRPASIPAERLASALKAALSDAGRTAGTPFERDAALVLRRLEAAVRETMAAAPSNRRAFLERVGRVIRPPDNDAPATAPADESPRLIIP